MTKTLSALPLGAGLVTIDGEAQNVISWEPDCILISEPGYDIYWRTTRPQVATVTTAKRCRLAANDVYYARAA